MNPTKNDPNDENRRIDLNAILMRSIELKIPRAQEKSIKGISIDYFIEGFISKRLFNVPGFFSGTRRRLHETGMAVKAINIQKSVCQQLR